MTKKTALGVLIPFALVLLPMWWNMNAVKHELVQANVAVQAVRNLLSGLYLCVARTSLASRWIR